MRDNRPTAPPIPREYLCPHIMAWMDNAAESNRMKEYLEKAFPNQLEYHIGNERHEACADPSKNSWIEIICYNGDSECVENAMRDFWKLNRMSQ